MKKVYAVHSRVSPAEERDRFEVELFADAAAAYARCAALEDDLMNEYADELEDDPGAVEVYVLELPIN